MEGFGLLVLTHWRSVRLPLPVSSSQAVASEDGFLLHPRLEVYSALAVGLVLNSRFIRTESLGDRPCVIVPCGVLLGLLGMGSVTSHSSPSLLSWEDCPSLVLPVLISFI